MDIDATLKAALRLPGRARAPVMNGRRPEGCGPFRFSSLIFLTERPRFHIVSKHLHYPLTNEILVNTAGKFPT